MKTTQKKCPMCREHLAYDYPLRMCIVCYVILFAAVSTAVYTVLAIVEGIKSLVAG